MPMPQLRPSGAVADAERDTMMRLGSCVSQCAPFGC
jgi:hypothetical protein